jgi:hypothetical protein
MISQTISYSIVETNVEEYYNNTSVNSSPSIEQAFYGQDANYQGNAPSYSDNGNAGQYPYFWSGTSHIDGINPYSAAVYIAFGEAQGKMNNTLMDVHGAGAQRSDPKAENATNYPDYFGTQGDVRYVFNYVRCVRDASESSSIEIPQRNLNIKLHPNPTSDFCIVHFDKLHSNINAKLLNFLGQNIIELNVMNSIFVKLSMENISEGCCFIFINADGNQIAKKIIKQ